MQKGRRKKVRYIQQMPQIAQFSPRGKAGRPNEIELQIDQYEAIKLADYQGYDQSTAATFMKISRSSFGRILRDGRKIVADALANGKIIRIRIGNAQVGVQKKNYPKQIKGNKDNNGRKKEIFLSNKILNYGSPYNLNLNNLLKE